MRDHRAAYQNRDGRNGSYQGRDNNRGERPQGGYQNRDGRNGGYQGRANNRGDRPQGGYQNRDGRNGGYQGRDNRGERPQGGYQNRDGRPSGRRLSEPWRQTTGWLPEPWGQTDRAAAIRTVETDHRAAIRTAMADHRAVSRTVTEIRAALAPVSEKIRIRTIQAETAAETTAVHLETETTVHLLLIPRSRPSQAAPVRQTRTLIRMTVLTRETEKKTDKKKAPKTGKGAFIMPQPKKEEAKVEDVKTITLPERLTIKELADKMKLQPSAIVKKLFLKGQMVTLNQEIDYDQAEEIAMEYDVLCEQEEKVDVIAELLKEEDEDDEQIWFPDLR